jgi:Tfp pilus assembly protein PilN
MLMKDISLLPPDIKGQARARRRRIYFLTGCGLVLLALLLLYLSLLMATWHTHNQANSMKNQRMAVERRMGSYQEYVDMAERIENIDRLIDPITGSAPDWAGLLVNVNHSIPGDVWLTDLTAGSASNTAQEGGDSARGAADSPNQLILRGYSYNYHSIAGWLEDIRQVPELSGVHCQFASEETVEGQPAISFEIRAGISAAGSGGSDQGGE